VPIALLRYRAESEAAAHAGIPAADALAVDAITAES
jgi:hypothetical protein